MLLIYILYCPMGVGLLSVVLNLTFPLGAVGPDELHGSQQVFWGKGESALYSPPCSLFHEPENRCLPNFNYHRVLRSPARRLARLHADEEEHQRNEARSAFLGR